MSVAAAAFTPTTEDDKRGSRARPILAERFKTKMCEKYEQTGECPYEARCMFAHGELDLRTKEMNMHDNLTTEEAIKAFQRARVIAARVAAQKKVLDQARKDKKKSGSQSFIGQCDDEVASESGREPVALLQSHSFIGHTSGLLSPQSQENVNDNRLNASVSSFRHDPYEATPTKVPRSVSPAVDLNGVSMTSLNEHASQQRTSPQVADSEVRAFAEKLALRAAAPQDRIETTSPQQHQQANYYPPRAATPSAVVALQHHPMPKLTPCPCGGCRGGKAVCVADLPSVAAILGSCASIQHFQPCTPPPLGRTRDTISIIVP